MDIKELKNTQFLCEKDKKPTLCSGADLKCCWGSDCPLDQTLTSIFLGLDSSTFGTLTLSTPSR